MACFPSRPRGLALLLLALCALAGCNLFNPSGEGTPDTVAGWIAEGDKHMASKEFGEAESAYSSALALDGRNDVAWDGWLEAKAGLAQQATGVSLASLLIETRKFENGTAKPFWGLPLEGQDRFYRYLSVLDSAFAVCLKGYGTKHFADPVRQASYTSVRAAWALLRLCDYDRNGRLSAADTAQIRICRDSPGSLSNAGGLYALAVTDLSRFLLDIATGKPDTAKTAELDAFILSTDTVFAQIGALASLDSRWSDLSGFLDNQGREASFRATADARDNDGDGCADEEVPDGLDNDADGLVDEDTRMGYRDPLAGIYPGGVALRTTQDAVDTSRLVGNDAVTGLVRVGRDPNLVDTVGLHYATEPLWNAYPGLLARYRVFVDPTDPLFTGTRWVFKPNWTQAALDSLGLTGGVPLKADSSRGLDVGFSHAQIVDIRLAVTGIADPARRRAAGTRLVGGCWTTATLATAGRAR